MKLILVLSVLCTLQVAHAEAKDVYATASKHCNDSDVELAVTSETSLHYELSDDKSVLETSSQDLEIQRSYNLRLVGKNKYLAIPQTESQNGEPDHFFVEADDDNAEIVIYANDVTGEQCGGGLTVSLLTKIQ